jgi:DNA-binding FadR family transcriptional regulator
MTLFTEHQGKWFAFFPRIDAAFHRVLEIAGNPVPSFLLRLMSVSFQRVPAVTDSDTGASLQSILLLSN